MSGRLIGALLVAALSVSMYGCGSMGNNTTSVTDARKSIVAKRDRLTVTGGLLIPYGEAVRLTVPHETVDATFTPLPLPSEHIHVKEHPSAQLLGMLPQGRRMLVTPPEELSATTRFVLRMDTTRGDLYTPVLFIPNPGFMRTTTPNLPQKTSGDRRRNLISTTDRHRDDTTDESAGDSGSLTHEQLAEENDLPAALAAAARQGGMSVQEFDDFIREMLAMGGKDSLTDSETWERVENGEAAGVLADQARDFFNIPAGVADDADAETIAWVASTISELGGDPGDSNWYSDFGGTARDHLGVPNDATKDRDVHDILEGMAALQLAGSDPSDPGAWEALAEGERQGKTTSEIIRDLLNQDSDEDNSSGVGSFVKTPSGSQTGDRSDSNHTDGTSDSSSGSPIGSSSDHATDPTDRADFGGSSDSNGNDNTSGSDKPGVILMENASTEVRIDEDGNTWTYDKNTGEVIVKDDSGNVIDGDDSGGDGNGDDGDGGDDNGDDDNGDDDNGDDDNGGDDNGDDDGGGDGSSDPYPNPDYESGHVGLWKIVAMGEMKLAPLIMPSDQDESGGTTEIKPDHHSGVIDSNPDYEDSSGSTGGTPPGFGVIDHNPDYEGGSSGSDALPGVDGIGPVASGSTGSSGGSGTHTGGIGGGVFLCVGEIAVCISFSEYRCCPYSQQLMDIANTYVEEHPGSQMTQWSSGYICLENRFVPSYQSACAVE